MRCFLACCLVLVAATAARAEDWPCWRGPRLDGSSTAKTLPLKWSATENIAWKTAIPGEGHSSPIVHGERVFLTSCLLKEKQRVLLCLDRRDGKILWQRTVFTAPLEPKHRLNSYASSTPATDGKYVWTSFLRLRPKADGDAPPTRPRERPRVPANLVPEMVITCWTVQGDKVWEVVPGRFYSPHGYCASVIPYKDTIILNGDQDAQAYLVALDKATGKERWRVDRPNRTRSYCVPLIVEAGGKTQMVLTGSLCVTSYDPDTGTLNWLIKGPTEQFVASPVYADGVFFITAGFPDFHNMGISPEGKILWHEKRTLDRKASYVPSPIAVAGKSFLVVSDLGWLSGFDIRSGKRLFLERTGIHTSGSPVVGAGHVYITDDDGATVVLRATGRYEPVGTNRLGEACHSSPALAGEHIYLRTDHHLWCIGAPTTNRTSAQR